MDFFNSRAFNIVKAAILALALFLTQQDGQAEAEKASGQPVTTIDLPASFGPILAAIYGMLQVGQKRP